MFTQPGEVKGTEEKAVRAQREEVAPTDEVEQSAPTPEGDGGSEQPARDESRETLRRILADIGLEIATNAAWDALKLSFEQRVTAAPAPTMAPKSPTGELQEPEMEGTGAPSPRRTKTLLPGEREERRLQKPTAL